MGGKLFPLPFGGSTLLTALSLSKGERVRVRGVKIHPSFIHIFPIFLATLLEKTHI